MEIEPRSGTYALILRVPRSQTISVGALGILDFTSDFYIYVGSAFGPGGLRARLTRHMSLIKKLHWHIDYLRQIADLTNIWFTYDIVQREHTWAEVIGAMPEIEMPIMGFGASDCQCCTHLFRAKLCPSQDIFYEGLKNRYPDHYPICEFLCRDESMVIITS